eukprot:CAMPEP_0198197428 /NCGR_PEP_ID=MMETSP1445-20131203/1056_1 /TAXON_ID=36898 /ORGANISM="Pyramimonas sp., Strain CCMP2087" /LENGTH=319 /DNA_ID=CAMNT_0043866719 /DNA_START=163 /DNA_END=1122 /DNA_ORIENTATION=-
MAGAVVPTLLRVPSATSGPLLAYCGMDRNCTNERVVRTCRTNGRSEVSLLGRAAASSCVGGRKEGRTLRVMSTMSAKETARRVVNNISTADGKLNEEKFTPIKEKFTPNEEKFTRPSGRIDIICGPMFSGKTTELLARVSAAKAEGKKVLLIKSAIDNRYSTSTVVTHDGVEMECIAVQSLEQLKKRSTAFELAEPQVIAIDEAQFFTDLQAFCLEAAELRHQQVVVAGLDGDFQRQRFGEIMDLLPLADTVTKLRARCEGCGGAALFSLRTIASTSQTLVGGADMYMPACRRCYHSMQPAAPADRKSQSNSPHSLQEN